LQKAGISVPEEMSITGFDNILFSAYTNPPLTTFDQPKRSIGAEAACLVLGLLTDTVDKDRNDPKIQMLRGRLLVRSSTAAPIR
jgi:DNA-binding LacI/PurR family transcriptional regulator